MLWNEERRLPPVIRTVAMLTLLIAVLVVAALVGAIGLLGIGGLTFEIGKALFFCAIVLVLISAVIDIVRGRARA